MFDELEYFPHTVEAKLGCATSFVIMRGAQLVETVASGLDVTGSTQPIVNDTLTMQPGINRGLSPELLLTVA